MAEPVVVYTVDGPVATVTLNRPGARNAISSELLTRLVHGAQQIALGADDSPYAINPWDVPDAREVSREKISFLISLHTLLMGDEGLGRAEVAQLGEAIRAVYAKAATLGNEPPRESMLRDELQAMAEHNQRHGG